MAFFVVNLSNQKLPQFLIFNLWVSEIDNSHFFLSLRKAGVS